MSTAYTASDCHDEAIRSQLAQLKDTFFGALHLGHSDLKSFGKSWKSFLAQVADSSSILEAATHSMISSFAQVVITLAATLIDAEAIHHQLEAEIASLAAVEFKRLSIHDHEPMPDPGSSGRYIAECYTWLLAHLHNPYPTKIMRLRICEETDSSIQDVDAWFKSARKNIGWNEIRRTHFETRFDMVKAATQFWKTSRTNRTSQSPEDSKDFSYEFAQMESRAQSLYEHKFFPTSLATNLEDRVDHSSTARSGSIPRSFSGRTPSQDVTKPSQCLSGSRKRRNSDVDSEETYTGNRPQRPLKRHRIATPASSEPNAESCFSSPAYKSHRGLSFSLSPSVVPSPLPEAMSPDPQTEKRKRRMSDTSDCDSDSSRAPRARRKRRANDQGDELLPRQVVVDPLRTDASSPQILRTLKRKRRLSDTMGDRPRKHPHHPAEMVARLHTVSNPYPMTSAHELQDIPETLSITLPDFTCTPILGECQNVEIEAFDYASTPGFADHLSQRQTASLNLNCSGKVCTEQVITPEIYAFEAPTATTNSVPFLGLNDSTVNQSILSYDSLFSGLPKATTQPITSDLWQYSLVGSDQVPITMEPSFINYDKTPASQIPGGLLFNSLLYPQESLPLFDPADLAVSHPSVISSNFDLAGASPVNFAVRKIQNLQAQIAMYKNQLYQCGVLPP